MSVAKNTTQNAIRWEESFPLSDASERAIIARLCETPTLFGSTTASLQAEDFQNDNYRFIYQLLREFYNHNQEWGWATVADALQRTTDRPKGLTSPAEFIGNLIVHACPVEQLAMNITNCNQLRIRKQLANTLPLLQQDIQNPTIPITNLIDSIKRLETVLDEAGVRSPLVLVTPKNFGEVFFREVEKRKSMEIIGTGYPSLDNVIDTGLSPGYLSIICGRPSMGKSTLRTNLTVQLANAGVSSMTIIKESNFLSEALRMISVSENISLRHMVRNIQDWNKVKQDDVIMDDWMKAKIAKVERDWPLSFIDCNGHFVLQDLRHHLRRAQLHGYMPKVVFVDLFAQLDDVGVSENQQAVMQQKINQVADMGKEFGVHMCLIVQLRRLGSQKGHKREDLDYREQLKGTGGFEERADLILMVERPAYYDRNLANNIMNIAIIKQREGVSPSFQFSYNPDRLLITDDLEHNQSWIPTPKLDEGEQREEDQIDFMK